MLKIDDNFICNFSKDSIIFKYIHPNYISCLSILLNIIITILVLKRENIFIVLYCIFLRWLTDCLDGNIARKYNKTSKLGGKLDTVGDISFFYLLFPFVVIYLKTKNIYLSILISTICLLIGVTHFIITDSEENHNNLKIKSKNKFKTFIAFCANNSCIVFLSISIAYIIYYYKV